MAGPFDYTLKGIQSPMDSFASGLQLGGSIQDRQRQREAAEQKAAQEAQMQADMAALSGNPTVGGIQRMMAKYPAMSDKFKPLLESMTATQKENRIRQANSIFMPLISGDKDLAIAQLNEQITAATNSGDVQSQKSLEALKKTLESEKTGQLGDSLVTIAMGSFLAEAMGPEQFAKTYEAIAEQRRKEEVAPVLLSTAKAEAKIKENEAQGIMPPKFVETESGIMQWDTKAGKLVPTGYKAFHQPQIQLSLGEGQKGFENETTLRKEFNAEAKPFNEVAASFSRLSAAAKDDSGASDIAMIYSYMKMLDPGSVVREGEFATAENAGGVGEKIRNLYNKAIEGTRLTPKVRQDYLSVAKRLHTESRVKFNKLKGRYTGIAKRASLNPENVTTLEEPEDAGITAPAVGTVEDGYRFKGGNPADPANWEKQ